MCICTILKLIDVQIDHQYLVRVLEMECGKKSYVYIKKTKYLKKYGKPIRWNTKT